MLKQKRSKYFFGLVTLILFGFNTFAQIDSTLQSSNLKVGLVLSGGGAKAMAHLGLLRIMDEEGLQPDYIAGTSMGAVLGAMYAMGYSATEIQLKMYQIHWADVMTNDRPRRSLSFLDKQTEDRYALSFPISKGKILLPDGINYGHHILNELDRLSVGFHDVTDLSQLQIPFICIATNLETGEGVVLDKGYLPDVLRATSSFPTLFSPHEIDSKVLVDGGLVSNLPFFLLDGKGMDVLIGSDVQTILYTREDLNSVLRIMEQLSSFVNAENYRSDTAKADFLVRTEVPGAGISSFELMDSIIRQGYRAAEKYRPRIKELARLKGLSAATSKPMQASSDTILIGKIVLPKSDLSSHNYLKSKLGIEEGSRVSLGDIKRGIDRIWGSQLFRTVDYSLLPIDSNSYSLNLRLDELNYLTHIRLGIHYDDDFQTAVLLNYTHRNLLLKNSKLSLDAAVGVNPRFWASYTFDREFIPTVRLSFRSHRFKSKIYVNQDLADEKVYLDFSGEFAVESAIYNRFLLSAGLQLENIDINNTRSSGLSAESNNNYLNYFGTLKLDLGDVHSMVSDVGAALDWARTESSAEPMPSEVTIAAHSAGAHLCSLHLSRAVLRVGAAGNLPDRFVALSGVFDIAPHFAHERTRSVHWLSPMWLVMMGRRVALLTESGSSAGEDEMEEEHPHVMLEELAQEASRGAEAGDQWSASELRAWARASPTRFLRAAQAAAAHHWPPTTVLHAEDDGTVPVRSAREFVHALRRAAGQRSDVHTYAEFGRGGHGEVMVALAGHEPLTALEPHIAELARYFLASVVQPRVGGNEAQAGSLRVGEGRWGKSARVRV